MDNRINRSNDYEKDSDFKIEIDEENLKYEEYDKYDWHGKQKSMKKLKKDSKPKWRSDRKKQKKFKHDILGMD